MNNREETPQVEALLKKAIPIVWYGLLVGYIAIAAVFYFLIPDMKIGDEVPAEYENHLFIAGVLSGVAVVFYRRYVGELLRSNSSLPDDEFWNLVKAKMIPGIAMAELPFFIGGLPAYLLYGSKQTYLILAAFSLILFFVVKPPSERL